MLDATSLPSPSQIEAKLQGAIRRLKDGYGFIACDDGQDYYFHWTGLEYTGPRFEDLSMRQRVEFHVALGHPKGPRAINVRVLPN